MEDDFENLTNRVGPELPMPTIADMLAAVRALPPAPPAVFGPFLDDRLGDFFGVVPMPKPMILPPLLGGREGRVPHDLHVYVGPGGFALFACTHLAQAYRPDGVPG